MKDRQKFSVRAFGNDGRRNENERIGIFAEAVVKDCRGSGDFGTDPVRLDLCGNRVYLRSGAGAYQHGGCPTGCGGSDYLLPAKRHHPAGNGVSHQSLWSANGCNLASGQGAGLKVCHSGFGL